MISLTFFIACSSAAFLIFITCIVYYQYTYWSRRKILHLKPTPILGNNSPIFFRTVSFPVHTMNLYKKLPGARYYGMFDFLNPAVLIKDPQLIREIGVKHFDHFTDHKAFVDEDMDPICGRNLFSLKGQRWKDVRSILSPSYTASRMKVLFDLILECSKEFVEYLEENPEATKNFECKESFTRYTNDVIATSAFGVKVNSMKDRDNEFYRQGKITQSIGSPLWILKIIFLTNFSKLMRAAGATFLPKTTDGFFKRLIHETIKVREEKGITRPDMLQLLINAMNKEDGNMKVTIEDVIGQSFIFFLAGFETSSALMCFMALELAVNSEVQQKLQKEIDEQFENDGYITCESLSQMKYLDMTINETLRKYPPATILNRVCVKDFKFPSPMEGYPGYDMEKGTVILVPIIGLHHDPKYYPEPEKFDPERFNDENKNKMEPYTFLPFGFGPRQCIGNRFALMESKIVIVHLLRKFVIKLSDKTKFPVEFSKRSFTLRAEDGLWLNLEKRKKND